MISKEIFRLQETMFSMASLDATARAGRGCLSEI
jgi:hypothetical protein